MKKNKINLKLTACLVSLFVGIVFMVLGNKNKYCLSFGLALLGIASSLFAFYKAEETKKINQEVESELEVLDENDPEQQLIELDLLKFQRKNNKKTGKTLFVFNVFAIIMIVLAFVAGI